MKSAFEQCIDRKAARFIVTDDGAVHLEQEVNAGLERISADASAYLVATAGMSLGDIHKGGNDLVPAHLRSDWRLGVQRENGYSVWTPYCQRLPSFAGNLS